MSPSDLGITLSNNKTVKIRMKNSTQSTKGKIYFTTYSNKTWNELKSKSFSIKPNDFNYTTYTIDMSDVPGWTGQLYRLRVDPNGGVTNGSFSCDYIRVQN